MGLSLPAFDLIKPQHGTLRIDEKNYTSLVNVKSLRRMSTIAQWSIHAAITALNENNFEAPQCIVTATGMGSQNEYRASVL